MRGFLHRPAVWVALVLAVACVAGGTLSGRVQAETDKTEARLRTFGKVLALVEENYVGETSSTELVEGALQGMLRTLDPHSNYLDRDSFVEMKDEQRGKFYGLGIQITKRGPDKPLTIIAPIDGTPAAKAGLQAGDVIYKIEGEETIGLTVQQAVRRLKGEKGTKVTITIVRPGDEAPFDVTLVRDEVPTHSIAVALMVRPGVGLIRISNFTGTTATELDQALKRLGEQGMERLLLDLRSNPGGLLEQAVQVSERFIPAGKLIVYTRGRIAGSDQDYVASSGVERTAVPLVVLVDHSSASASEIVSGAIQDHDRGLVVGETTFGKGLVQRVIPLRDGGALALTTAKYYTPSGRLIQRDFSDLDDYFLEPEEMDLEPAPTDESAPAGREVRSTDAGRLVYGGGGITPDYVVKVERMPAFVGRLIRDNLLFDFSVRYVQAHPELAESFVIERPQIEEFRQYLISRNHPFSEQEIESGREVLALRLRAQIARVKWGPSMETRILSEGDPQVQKALTLFEEAARLAKSGEAGREQRENSRRQAASGPSSSI